MSLNAAKLRIEDINAIVALSAARFTNRSIARVYSVCTRAIADVLHGRSFKTVPRDVVALPLLELDRASRLVVLAPGKLNVEQQAVIERYAETLAATADPIRRQVYAAVLLKFWRPTHRSQLKGHRGKRFRLDADAGPSFAEAVAAAAAEDGPDPSRSCSAVARG